MIADSPAGTTTTAAVTTTQDTTTTEVPATTARPAPITTETTTTTQAAGQTCPKNTFSSTYTQNADGTGTASGLTAPEIKQYVAMSWGPGSVGNRALGTAVITIRAVPWRAVNEYFTKKKHDNSISTVTF